jgi:predicted aldo/keto reductase-like oxidoreductase
MFYRNYGNTGIRASALGFGCMRFPTYRGRVRRRETIKMLRRAMDLGVNYFDSAHVYTGSEEALGQAVKGRRDEVYISTKNHYKGDDPKEWRKLLDESLERLGVDYIDIYHLHDLRLEHYTDHLLPGGCIDEARKARDEGLIGHLCVSSHDDPQNVIKLIDTGTFDGLLVQYNLFDRSNEKPIQHAHEKGLGVSIMGTIGGGQLIPLDQKVRGMADGHQSIPELAIRFVLSNPAVSVALSGMGSLEMVEENVAAASREEPFGPEEEKQIAEVIDQAQQLEGLYCTGCDYCMPCSSGVDIPANFAAWNLLRVWGVEAMSKIQYSALGNRREEGKAAPAWAAACTECHECEEKCPQSIPIPDKLKEAKEALTG